MFEFQEVNRYSRWILLFEADYERDQVGTQYNGTYRKDPITYLNKLPMFANDVNNDALFGPTTDLPMVSFFDMSRMTEEIQQRINAVTSTPPDSTTGGTWEAYSDNTFAIYNNGGPTTGPFPINPGLF